MAGPRIGEQLHRATQLRALNKNVGWSANGGYGPKLIGHGPQLVGYSGYPQIVPGGYLDQPFVQQRDRRDEHERLRPFTLKCPTCMSPTAKPPDGVRASVCKYCNVPLTWEPRESFGRDDFGLYYDSARADGEEVRDRRPPPPADARLPDGVQRFVRGLGPALMYANCAHTFEIMPSLVTRFTHLWIDRSIAQNFIVGAVKIGDRFLTEPNTSLPGAACADGDGLNVFGDETVSVGMKLTIDIVNLSAGHMNFHGILRGMSIQPGAFHR